MGCNMKPVEVKEDRILQILWRVNLQDRGHSSDAGLQHSPSFLTVDEGDILSRDILSRDILSRDILSRDILSRDILSRDILSRDILLSIFEATN